MSKIKEIEVDGEYFTSIPNLYFHSGKFWYNEKEVKEVYNNGSKSILIYGSTKMGVKKLRTFAKPCRIKLYIEPLPF